MQGFLYKKTADGKWQKRFFMLDNKSLYYKSSEESLVKTSREEPGDRGAEKGGSNELATTNLKRYNLTKTDFRLKVAGGVDRDGARGCAWPPCLDPADRRHGHLGAGAAERGLRRTPPRWRVAGAQWATLFFGGYFS